MNGPHVRLKPKDFVGDGLTGSGQLEPSLRLFDEALLVKPLREAMTCRS
jgi:hypothetical protein